MKNQIIIILFLLAAFCAAPVFAQEKSVSENQCQMLSKEDFVGEKIDVFIIDAELREILNYFTEQFGCDFVSDEKTTEIRITLKIKDTPWNIALSSILKSKDLDLKQVGTSESKPLFRIGNPNELSGMICKYLEIKIDDLPLYTEIIQVKNLPSEYFHKLKKYVERRISKRGKIEVNESTKTFIITDVPENLDSIKTLIEYLDNEDYYNKIDENK